MAKAKIIYIYPRNEAPMKDTLHNFINTNNEADMGTLSNLGLDDLYALNSLEIGQGHMILGNQASWVIVVRVSDGELKEFVYPPYTKDT